MLYSLPALLFFQWHYILQLSLVFSMCCKKPVEMLNSLPMRLCLVSLANNPDAPKMLDRILALLASHDVLKCLVVQDEQKLGSLHRLYSMTPVARFFAPNSDGVSLGPFLALMQDNVFLASWLVHLLLLF